MGGPSPATRSGGPAPELHALAAALGTTLIDGAVTPWGDARATYRLSLADGSAVAARQLDAADSNAALGVCETMARAARSGIPVPPARVVEADGDLWLVSDWVPGDAGAGWLDTPRRAQLLAWSMGGLLRDLRRLDPFGLAPERSPGLTTSVRSRERVDILDRLDRATSRSLLAARDLLGDPVERRASFVHGDFAPVNVVVGPDATILALLDHERAHPGDSLEDAAWWSWVVRFHHPAAWAAAWRVFCTAAGIDLALQDATIRAHELAVLAARAETAPDADRDAWIARLAATARW